MRNISRRRGLWLGILGASAIPLTLFSACGSEPPQVGSGSTGATGGSSTTSTGGTGGEFSFDGSTCEATCSNDLKNVVDCKGAVLATCKSSQGCANGACIDDPCKAAEISKSSYGCDYWALKTALRPQADGACFAAFVANTWDEPVQLTVERGGTKMPVETFAYIPEVKGQGLDYLPYDPAQGLGVGQVAILFLSRQSFGGSVVDCPRPAALDAETGVAGTGLGEAFHITTNRPVVAYQISPYGGAQAYVTAASLLLPTSAWDTNYIAINAYKSADPPYPGAHPSLAVLAHQDDTEVTLLPQVDIQGGGGVAAATAGAPVSYKLARGQFLQITQPAELTGSPLQANKPVAVFGAATCMSIPLGEQDCDSAQQQIAPVRAMGSEYAAVRYKNRGAPGAPEEAPPWRLVGMVDGTQLAWEPMAPEGAPTTLGLGDVVEFNASGPFVVKSQDPDHPFYLGGYMTGGKAHGGVGDPEWVNVIPPSQYLNRYVLFTDPTYPETSLVVTRTRSKVDGEFADVTLGCAGVLSGWQPLGEYEYTRVNLVTGDFMGVGGCTNGRQEMTSDLPFGVTVWGWGTTQQTKLVSYAYPAGAGFQPINEVTIPPVPK